MKVYEVMVSGAVEVQAESAEEAKDKAMQSLRDTELGCINADSVFEIEDLGDQT